MVAAVKSHPFDELVINPGTSATAALLFTPCPGTKGVDITTALTQLKAAGAVALISLTPDSEMQQLQVNTIPALCRELGLGWFHCPIEDDQAPGPMFAINWQVAAPQVHQWLRFGDKIAIHCKGGSGRTGLLAAQILLELGLDKIEAKSRVQALRPYALRLQPHLDYFNKLK